MTLRASVRRGLWLAALAAAAACAAPRPPAGRSVRLPPRQVAIPPPVWRPSGSASSQGHGAGGPLPSTLLARALDAVLRSAQDAYLLPGVVVVAVDRHGDAWARGYGVRSLQPGGRLPVDLTTAFAAAGLAAAPSGGPRAQGHAVDLRRGEVTALPAPGTSVAGAGAEAVPGAGTEAVPGAGTTPAAVPVGWYDGAGLRPWLRQALAGCDADAPGAPTASPAPLPAPLAAPQPVPGYTVHLARHCDRRLAYAVLVNVTAGEATQALVDQLAAAVAAYAPTYRPW